MLREFENWGYFPVTPAPYHEKTRFQRFDETVNRYAVQYVAVILAGAPWFWIALFLSYLAGSFGIIS